MSDHDFETIERLAIQMCEESRGVGHWEKYKTKRQHSSLGYRPPAPEVIQWPASPSGAASPDPQP